jgi:hypothetical protein
MNLAGSGWFSNIHTQRKLKFFQFFFIQYSRAVSALFLWGRGGLIQRQANDALADQVWDLWNEGETDDETACIAWMLIAGVCSAHDKSGGCHTDV